MNLFWNSRKIKKSPQVVEASNETLHRAPESSLGFRDSTALWIYEKNCFLFKWQFTQISFVYFLNEENCISTQQNGKDNSYEA